MNNPYVELIEQMKQHGSAYNPPSILLGEVISDNPLIVTIGDLQINKENIYISDLLLSNYKRKIKIPITTATGIAGEHNISSIGINNAEIDFIDSLKSGDTVCIMPMEDRQTYIILCKVVRS